MAVAVMAPAERLQQPDNPVQKAQNTDRKLCGCEINQQREFVLTFGQKQNRRALRIEKHKYI